jgi:hypothetical protein
VKQALLLLALLALPASAQHKPWFVGTQKTGATQWVPPAVPLTITHKNSNTATGTTSVTVTGITTSGASLIVIGAGTGSTAPVTISGVTVGGNAATQRATVAGPNANSRTDVWTYWSSGALAGVSVVATATGTGDLGCAVFEATGTDSSSPGATNTAGPTTSGTTAVSVTTTANDSIVTAFMFNFSGTQTAGTNTGLISSSFTDGASDYFATAKNTQTTTSGNSYTVTATHTSGAWAAAALEIKKAP